MILIKKSYEKNDNRDNRQVDPDEKKESYIIQSTENQAPNA